MTIPRPYQIRANRRIERKFKGRSLVALTMGLGKSFVALTHAKSHPELLPMLVICPASVKYAWQDEARKHLGWPAIVLETIKPNGRALPTRPKVAIINYDILKPWLDYLLRLDPGIVVIDESQRISSFSSQRTRNTWLLCQNAKSVLALSGTPLLNRPAELWPTLNILRPDLFPAFQPFAWEYCQPEKVYGKWEYKGASNLDALHDLLLDSCMVRYRLEDVVDQLPAKRTVTVPLPLSSPDEYLEARDEFLSWLRKRFSHGRVMRAARSMAVTHLGYLKRLVGRLKLPAVEGWIADFLEGSEGKLLVFGTHRSLLEYLYEKNKAISVLINGSIVGKARYLAVQKFQTHSKCRVVFGNNKAAGEGITLTAANSVAFAEYGWTPGEHDQAIARCYARANDMHGATVYFLVGTLPGGAPTIEAKLLKLIRAKGRNIGRVLDGSGGGKDAAVYDQVCKSLLEEGP
jgi:SWI/SNF-related matrix-associated actin-dependent regulator 1 of chromatin subfamily A